MEFGFRVWGIGVLVLGFWGFGFGGRDFGFRVGGLEFGFRA